MRKQQSKELACVTLPLRAAELVELAAVGEDDERDLGVAEDGELVGLLEQAVAALGEGDLAVDLVLDPLELHPAPPHGGGGACRCFPFPPHHEPSASAARSASAPAEQANQAAAAVVVVVVVQK
jgi:hypothetical protein